MAQTHLGVETLNYEQQDVSGELLERSGGRGPDVRIQAGKGGSIRAGRAPRGYEMVKQKSDGCVRAVFQPTG
ncbi:hypothetical protein [Micromonospora zamorensis]|uniref:hypothetical protein n=1 Tax=Micromonospora zamorensis TaxID=709883 RepID=UPI003CF1CA58